MLPVKKPVPHYRTLEEIQLRKDELLDDLQRDNEKFTKLWDHLFPKHPWQSFDYRIPNRQYSAMSQL